MAKFILGQRGYLQNAIREEGAVLDFDCKPAKEEGPGVVKIKDGTLWTGNELPPKSAKRAADDAKAEKRAPLAKEPVANP